MYERLVLNVKKSSKIRYEDLEDRKHIVVPGVMLVEGVHAGNKGPMLYLNKNISKNHQQWNHRPVVLYHPEMNGQAISACDPIVINSRKLGVVLNTSFDDKLKFESWIDEKRVKKIDQETHDRITNEEMLEVSTGFDCDSIDEEGDWDGPKGKEHYVGIIHNIRPDHLAILPDAVGACSIADGAGLFANAAKLGNDLLGAVDAKVRKELEAKLNDVRGLIHNELSHGRVYNALVIALRAKLEASGVAWYGYIEEVFSTYVVYCSEGLYWRINYKASEKNGTVTFTSEPQKVMRVIEYRYADGAIRLSAEQPKPPTKEKSMDRKQLVDTLIANSGGTWVEDDREFLTKLTDPQFEKINKKAPAPPPAPTTNKETPVPNPTPTTTLPVEPTREQIINALGAETWAAIQEGLDFRAEAKGQMIVGILANKAGHGFTKEVLEAMPLKQLEGVAKLAGVAQVQNTQAGLGLRLAPNYSGQAPTVVNEKEDPKPLKLPSMKERLQASFQERQSKDLMIKNKAMAKVS